MDGTWCVDSDDDMTSGDNKAPARNNHYGSSRQEEKLNAVVLLHLERRAHRDTKRQLKELRKKYDILKDELDNRDSAEGSTGSRRSVGSDVERLQLEHDKNGSSSSMDSGSGTVPNERLAEELKLKEMTISQLRSRILQLEKARLDKIPMDAAKEISRLQSTLVCIYYY